MPGDFHRSLNLAQAAAVGLYEALRQTRAGELAPLDCVLIRHSAWHKQP